MLKKVIQAFVFTAIFLIAFLATEYILSIFQPASCEKPITYTLGSFDKRFGISQSNFLSAMVSAEAIWEKPLGKELFTYTPEAGEIAVNLVYDYRQEVTKTLSNLEGVVKTDQATYNELQARYLSLKTEYETAKGVYSSLVESFNEKSSVYEDHVEAWNRSKRNSQEQFDKLEEERISLEFDLKKLKTLEGQLNTVTDEINSLVETLNHIAQSLNLKVEKFNTIGASRGESFTGGLYTQSEDGRSIDIYEFSSQDKLVRILAHELGHALGLEHLDDTEAIMYYLNKGEAGVLTKADLAALQALCYNGDIKN